MSLFKTASAITGSGTPVASFNGTPLPAGAIGDAVFVVVQWALSFGGGGPDPTAITVTDNAGNVYTPITGLSDCEDTNWWNAFQLFWCPSVSTAGALTHTASFATTSPGYPAILALRCPANTVLDTGATNTGGMGYLYNYDNTAGTSANNVKCAANITPSAAGSMFVGFAMNTSDGTAISVGTSGTNFAAFTSRAANSANFPVVLETFDQTTAAAIDPAARISSGGVGYQILGMVLKVGSAPALPADDKFFAFF